MFTPKISVLMNSHFSIAHVTKIFNIVISDKAFSTIKINVSLKQQLIRSLITKNS